jgi:hypothetical protein
MPSCCCFVVVVTTSYRSLGTVFGTKWSDMLCTCTGSRFVPHTGTTACHAACCLLPAPPHAIWHVNIALLFLILYLLVVMSKSHHYSVVCVVLLCIVRIGYENSAIYVPCFPLEPRIPIHTKVLIGLPFCK